MFSYPIDNMAILKNRKTLKNQFLEDGQSRIKTRIAVLSGSAVNDIAEILELFLLHLEIEPAFHISDLITFPEESTYPENLFKSFKPDIVFIHTSFRNISNYPAIHDSEDIVEEKLNKEFSKYFNIWENLKTTYQCVIIQNNFETPYYRILGNKDVSSPHGKINFINRLNLKFHDYANKNQKFYINDINYLSAFCGLERWSDPLYWYMYKYTVALPLIPEFAHNLANIIKSVLGKNKKALTIDLDNTFWGGDISNKASKGIFTDAETTLKEGYLEFQSYIKALKDIGVILTLCSKNDYEKAAPILECHDNILKQEDFSAIKINNNPKHKNLTEIADDLNIFPDSIVFLDNSPVEREIIKTHFPNIMTPEINEVENYIKILDRSGFFEVTQISEEDLSRNELYLQNRLRAEHISRLNNYGEYLNSLEMIAAIEPFSKTDFKKITQLINETNQFNLTVKRYQQFEIENIASSNRYISFTGRLIDKFGDNGIVSAVIAEIKDNSIHIDLWIINSRVLKRDMEYAMMDILIDKAAKMGITEIYGYFHPGDKNRQVMNIYSEFGFKLINAKPSGDSVWFLDGELYKSKNKHIKIEAWS